MDEGDMMKVLVRVYLSRGNCLFLF